MSGPTVVVVGAGVMGLGAGAALAEAGANVTVLERYHVAHDWASSHGLSRAIRHEYGPLAQYTAMVARSLVLWDELARETVRRLYIETGVLTLGQSDDGHTLPGLEVMRAAGAASRATLLRGVRAALSAVPSCQLWRDHLESTWRYVARDRVLPGARRQNTFARRDHPRRRAGDSCRATRRCWTRLAGVR